MGKYDNLNRPGTLTSASMDPRSIELDIDETIRMLEPTATPLLTLGAYVGKGPKPKNHKFETRKGYGFDPLDRFNNVTMGAGAEMRFARVTPAQLSRPTTSQYSMYYRSQDKFKILSTGQVVEVVMTNVDRIPTSKGPNGSVSDFALSAGLVNNGGSTTATAFGEIIVRNIQPYPLIPFTAADVYFLDRTIYESQDIEATPKQRQWIYDCNFPEHKEVTLAMTEDVKEWIKTKGTVPIWKTEEIECMKEFRTSVELTLWTGEKSVSYDNQNRPTYHTEGALSSIKDNITLFNPDGITDFEKFLDNFLMYQGFKYNPNGNKKLLFCGPKFLQKFNEIYKDMRRIDSAPNVTESAVKLDIQTYEMHYGKVSLVRNDLFRIGSEWEWYAAVMDPKEMQLRLVKDFTSRVYNENTKQRDITTMMEWHGGMAFHRTESSALLKPFNS